MPIVWLGLALGCGAAGAPSSAKSPGAVAPPVVVAPPPEAAAPPAGEAAPERKTVPIALALVVDRSGSMTGLPMEMTLDALRAAVRELAPTDWVTIVMFDSVPHTVVALRERGAEDSLDAAISRIQPGGGTDILPALAHAGSSLEAPSLPERRHVILMSDGQAPNDGLEGIVGKLRSSGTTVSTIALGDQAAEELLAQIASLGAGRYQRVSDPTALPAVFRDEVAAARGSR